MSSSHDLERTIIEPLLDFRRTVSPLNRLHNQNIEDFTRVIMGLLTGSDGGIEFQGPGANALAELVGQFLDRERQLAGTDPSTLEGRLHDAAVICEKYAHNLQDMLRGRRASSAGGLPFANLLGDPGGNDQESEPAEDAIGELYQFQGEMQVVTQEPLPEPPNINRITSPLNPVTEPLPSLPGRTPIFCARWGFWALPREAPPS